MPAGGAEVGCRGRAAVSVVKGVVLVGGVGRGAAADHDAVAVADLQVAAQPGTREAPIDLSAVPAVGGGVVELAASLDRGEQVSILIAAEWRIYGRFGYGAATEHQTWTVDASAAELRHRPQGTVEYVDRDTARALAPEVYERHRSTRPGEISRPEYFWDIDFGILRYPSWSESKPAFHVVTRNPAGLVTGVARYRYEAKWDHRQPRGQVTVRSFLTENPAAEALLWHHLLTLDLTTSVRVEDRPADELLPLLLTDARHASQAAGPIFCGSVRSMLPECSPPAPI